MFIYDYEKEEEEKPEVSRYSATLPLSQWFIIFVREGVTVGGVGGVISYLGDFLAIFFCIQNFNFGHEYWSYLVL